MQVRGEAVCGTVRQEDLDAASIKLDGRELEPGHSLLVMAAVSDAVSDYIDQEMCTTLEAGDGTLKARAVLNGMPRPDLDQPVMWVSKADGYRVAP